MDEEKLAEIEGRVWPKYSGIAARAYLGDVAALTTELRRCWAEIEELKKRLERLRRHRESLEGLPEGATSPDPH